MFDIAHGASLSAVWGQWARYVYQNRIERFVRFAKNVWNITEGSDEEIALAGIQATVDYFKSIGVPDLLQRSRRDRRAEPKEVLRDLTDRCTFHGARTIGTFQVLDGDDIYNIYQAANV